ncbi:MAG: response regulator [Deltaproteobacteria bacterium]|nr:response regulator [Deltaproteobacteria bacterium]
MSSHRSHSDAAAAVAPPDVQALVHELEVHQAELELQNHELRRAYAELAAGNAEVAFTRDLYRAVHELAPVPLVTLDHDGAIVDVNHAALALLASPRPGLIARRFALFVTEAGRARLAAWLHALTVGAGPIDDTLTLIRDDGAEIAVQVAGVAIRDPRATGTTLAVLALTDLTASRQAAAAERAQAKAIAEAQRLASLGVLAGGIAHDFNNLLTVVMAGASSALRTMPTGTPAALALVEVGQAARHAGDLAHQMLAYAGRQVVQARPIELALLVHDIASLIHAATKRTPLSIEVPDGLWVTGDPAQLRQVVLNLVINAAEAMQGRAGGITLTAGVDPGGIAIAVRDEGIGMDDATRARIFEPYFSTKFTGRGLGLAVVDGIVRAHGGRLEVTSAVDVGTTFTVHLPARAAGAAVAADEVTDDSPWHGAGTVLVVDDDDAVRRGVTRMLAGLGFAVVGAGDGVEGVAALSADLARIDLVVVDHTMPRLDGIGAATAMRALGFRGPIVLITGYGDVAAAPQGLFDTVLAKPFGIDVLRRTLRGLLASPAHAAPA